MSSIDEAWEPAGEKPPAPEPTLNDELAAEAQRVHHRGLVDLARRGTEHDPDL